MNSGVIGWSVSSKTDVVQSLHLRTETNWSQPSVWIMSPTDSCLVLGSSQDDGCIDYLYAKQKNIGIARRTSGGGAVLVDPYSLLWVDLFIPRGHAFWIDDIREAANWIGKLWQKTLRQLGINSQLHDAPFEKTEIAELVCFAGRGPGELLIDQKKVLGLSQRRTRAGVRFQCALALEWRPDNWIELFDISSIENFHAIVSNSGTSVQLEKDEVLQEFFRVLNN
ncbi:MAG: hypothetical protein CL470_08730 [Acidimicrobiaceae bacterium]|nr:hypothetical protein [Acidimicrobiaceae bacterium]